MQPTTAERPDSSFGTPVDLVDARTTQALCGNHNEHLKLIERLLEVRIGQRGYELLLSGTPKAVVLAGHLIAELLALVRAGRRIDREDVEQAVKLLEGGQDPSEIFLGTVLARGRGRPISPRSLNQKRFVEAMQANDLVFAIGPAGTGKTYLAMAVAVAFLLEKRVRRIVLCRPAVEAGEKLGFLPGDLAEKVNPYLRPLYDALHDMVEPSKAARLVEEGTVEVAPLAFMRGRTLADAFVILDEAQNTTVEQMKMFLTRQGPNSKAVVTGDVTQIDLPQGRTSGLVHARQVLQGLQGVVFAELSEIDVVRHPLVQEIVRAYGRAFDEERKEPA